MAQADGGEPLTEVELQFDAPDLERVAAWLAAQPAHAAFEFEPAAERLQIDRYYDTDDWRCYRAGYALRVRQSGEKRELTLKALGQRSAGGAPLVRTEHSERMPAAAPPAAAPSVAPSVAPPGPLSVEGDGPVAVRLRAVAGREPLRALFTVETHRRPWFVRQGDVTLLEIALDDTTIRPPLGAPRGLRRVEIEEATPGALDRTRQFVEALVTACDLVPGGPSKFGGGLEAAGLDPGTALPDLGPTVLQPADATRYAYALLRRRLADLLAHEPGSRLGEDAEAVHQMRVASRRLRAILSAFRPLLPPSLVALREEIRWLARSLSEVRDLDVQLEALEAGRAEAGWDERTALEPLVALLTDRRRTARAHLLDALDSERYARLVADATALLREGPPADAPLIPVQGYAPPIVRKRFRRVQRGIDAISPASPAAEYHALRVLGKRLRYAVELVADCYGAPAERYVAVMKAFQDVLGEHQDAHVAIEFLRGIAVERGRDLPPETLLLMGSLIERRREAMRRLEAEFPRHAARVTGKRWRRLWRRMKQARPRSRTAPQALAERAVPLPPALPPGVVATRPRSLLAFRRLPRLRPPRAQ